MDHLLQTAITRATLTYEVDGKSVGTMQTCSSKTFHVKSGYWNTKFYVSMSLGFGHNLMEQVYRPGATQYLYMYPAGQGSYYGKWVDKAEADRDIAEIRKIGQMF